jgi:arylsulfatase A-like enzyme
MLLRTRIWLLLAGSLVTACRASTPPPNVLLIVIDTLRADRVGWYGTNRQLTPFLDSLAERGTVFWNAYAQGSWTAPSVASLLTSRYQSQHQVASFDSVLADEELTLAEVLRRSGWVNGGFTANVVLGGRRGYQQGFDRWVTVQGDVPPTASFLPDPRTKPRAHHVHQQVRTWLEDVQRQRPAAPIFLYLQYMEPHTPYGPPPDAVERMLARHPDPARGRAVLDALRQPPNLRQWNLPDPEFLAPIEDLYDAEVYDLDRELRTLFADLERRGFLANAVVIVTADHGEEFMDHGRMQHASSLYEEIIHVPLLVRVPADTTRRDAREMVQLIDVAPTILALAGVPAPPSFEGRTLTSPATDRRFAYSEQTRDPAQALGVKVQRHERSVVAGSHKLLLAVGGDIEAYDLANDPAEHHADGLPAPDRQRLQATMTDAWRRAQRNPSPPRRQRLDADTRDRLRALGYAD